MRIDDYQKWLDAQFIDVDDTPDPSPEPIQSALEIEPISRVASMESQPPEGQVQLAPFAAATLPEEPQPYAPAPVYVEPQPILRTEPQPAPLAAEDEIPAIDQYIPFLRGRADTPTEPAPILTEPEATPSHPDPIVAAPSIETAAPEPEFSELQSFPAAGEPSADQEKAVEPVRTRWTPVSAVPAPPLDSDRLWNLVPKHLHVLLAMESDEIAQNSYKRQFKESRIDLISRLLDPSLSLEDTARLLNVCPTTVRRYTNKGLLTHQRTQGDQRRFKLSDVLAFLEAQSRPNP